MADRFLALELKNLSYIRLREMFGTDMIHWPEWVKELYQVTTPQCQLREYIVASCVYDLHQLRRPTNWDEVIDANESFAVDISKVFARGSLQAREKSTQLHPYQMEQYCQLKQRAAIASALSSAEVHPGQPSTDLMARDGFRARASGFKTVLDPFIERLYENIDNISGSCFRPRMTGTWPHKHLSTDAMRRAGWYHYPVQGKLDQVRCLHCESTEDDLEG